MDQYLYIPFLGGWTSIYQLFWCSPGVQGFDTLPYEWNGHEFCKHVYAAFEFAFLDWTGSRSPLLHCCKELECQGQVASSPYNQGWILMVHFMQICKSSCKTSAHSEHCHIVTNPLPVIQIYQILPRNPGWLSDLFILGSQTLGVSICINFWDQNSLTMPCFSHELRAQLKFTTFGTSDDVTIADSKSTATSRCCSLSLSTSVYLILPIYSTHTLRISSLYLCTLYVLLMYMLCMYYWCTMYVLCLCNVCLCMSMYLCVYVSIYLSIYLPIYLSIYLSVRPSVCLSVRRSVSLSLSPWSLVKSKLWCIYLIYQSTVIQSIPLQFYISIQQYAYQSQATVSITPQGCSMPLCQSPRRLPVAALLASLHAIGEAHHVWTPFLAKRCHEPWETCHKPTRTVVILGMV